MWVGTEGDGLYLLSGNRETVFRAPASLPDNSILAILEDRERSIWVGTADGLARLSAPDVAVLNSRDGLSGDNVSTIYCDRRGTLWLTTVTGGVFQYAAGRVEPMHLPPPAASLRFRGAFEDHNGSFWFGTSNQGVVRVRQRTATVSHRRAAQWHSKPSSKIANAICGSAFQRAQPLGQRAFNFYLDQGLSYGWVQPSPKTTMETCWWARIAGPASFTTAAVTDPAFAARSPGASGRSIHSPGYALDRHPGRRRFACKTERRQDHDPRGPVEQLHLPVVGDVGAASG
jgi:hypothetical protein